MRELYNLIKDLEILKEKRKRDNYNADALECEFMVHLLTMIDDIKKLLSENKK